MKLLFILLQDEATAGDSKWIMIVSAIVILGFSYLVFNKLQSASARVTAFIICIILSTSLVMVAVNPDSILEFGYGEFSLKYNQLKEDVEDAESDNEELEQTLKNLGTRMKAMETILKKTTPQTTAGDNITASVDDILLEDFKADIVSQLKASSSSTSAQLSKFGVSSTDAKKVKSTGSSITADSLVQKIKIPKTATLKIGRVIAQDLQNEKRGDQVYLKLSVKNTDPNKDDEEIPKTPPGTILSFAKGDLEEMSGFSHQLNYEDIVLGKTTVTIGMVIKWGNSWYLFDSHTFTRSQLTNVLENKAPLTFSYDGALKDKTYQVEYSIVLGD